MSLAFTIPDELVERIAERAAELVAARADEPEPWFGVEQAAEHLACKPHRIYGLVHRGEVPYRKDGARLLFRRSELDAWLDGHVPARCHPVATPAASAPVEPSHNGATGPRPAAPRSS